MTLEIAHTEDGYRLDGELDMATAGELSNVLLTAATGDEPIVLDLSGVKFMDSSGLRVILEGARSDDCGPVVIKDPSEQVRRLLEITIPDGAPGLRVRSTPHPEPPFPRD
ncbi:MAG TPA: STAS domain-containing protein [Actinomycetota bacterium]|nr:STAS domain-containing protein [Actinomycetota bacterium]